MIQNLMHIVDAWLLPLSLWLVMFAMGLSLVGGDFRKIVDNRRGFVLGAGSMILLVPIVGILISVTFAPTPALMMGFILLATCPGGLLSNLLTNLSRGDLALSVSMSLFTSVVYIFTLPFTAYYAYNFVFAETRAIDIPLASSFWEIFKITVVPIACGMAVRRWLEPIAHRITPLVKQTGTIMLVAIFLLIVWRNLDTLRSSIGIVASMVLGMNIVNLLLALLVSHLGSLRREERIAVVIEHLIRQEATAIYVAVTLLGRTDMSLPMIINTFIGMFFCVIFVSVMKRRHARVAAEEALHRVVPLPGES